MRRSLVTAVLVFSVRALAIDDCVAGERKVNLNNGASTAGFTGIVRCFDRDSKEETRTISYVNGRQSGWEKRKWPGGRALDAEYRDGKRHGEQRRYENGRLVELTHYIDDHEAGESLRYGPAGQVLRRVQRRTPDAASTWEDFDEQGQRTGAGCGLQSSREAGLGDCKWQGTSPLTFFHEGGVKRALIELKDGLRHGLTTTFDRDGRVIAETHYKAGKRDGLDARFDRGLLERSTTYVVGERAGDDTEFFSGGSGKKQVTTWQGGEQVKRVEYFQNGARKHEWVKAGDHAVESDFDDLGRLTERRHVLGRQLDGPWERFFPDGGVAQREAWVGGQLEGRRQAFFEDGRPAEDSQWKEGRVSQRTRWDPDGGVLEDEAYFQDGSRKKKPGL